MAVPASSKRGQIIDGEAIAAEIREELKAEIVATLPRTKGVPPKLAVVLVGERKDSETYVRMKTKACQEVGIQSDQRNLPEQVTEEKLLALIAELNADASVAGILVQLPLPKHINQDRVIGALNPEKDADGLHAVNLGRLVQQGQVAPVVPCTPLGCMELLKRSGVQLEGKRAAVLGRSILVGKPMALLLLSANATVTMCHSKTPDLPEILRQSDIVVAAIGHAEFVKGEHLKEGCVVIDVGMNSFPDATKKTGQRLVGDVHFASASEKAQLITPVPKGVGPMTVAMLLRNTVSNWKRAHGLPL